MSTELPFKYTHQTAATCGNNLTKISVIFRKWSFGYQVFGPCRPVRGHTKVVTLQDFVDAPFVTKRKSIGERESKAFSYFI